MVNFSIDVMSGDRIVGAVQNADINIVFAGREGWGAWRPERGPVPGAAVSITLQTDLISLYLLNFSDKWPYTVIARSDDRELWRCTGCVVDRDHPGRETNRKNGLVIRDCRLTARSYASNGETVTVPGD